MRLLYEGAQGFDAAMLEQVRQQVPDAWHVIEMDIDVTAPKEKITLYLDRAVVRCFRAMGAGYQARINRILETWMQMKMAELRELELGFLEVLEVTRAEQDAPEPEGWEAVRDRALAEDWAYRQGYQDGQAGREAPGTVEDS